MSQTVGKTSIRLDVKCVLPIAVFIVALLIRSIGIGWGLKNDLHYQSYHPDEQVNWAVSQQVEPAKLQFDPKFYSYGTLYFTVLGVASDMVTVYGGGSGKNDVNSFWGFVSKCHLAGRWINAVAGAATALLVCLMLRRWTNDIGAAGGALLVAFAPGHVVHSRFQTVDVFAVFLLAVSAFYALRLLPREGEAVSEQLALKFAMLSGVFAGLSAGTKYTGILGLLTLFVALGLGGGKNLVRDGLAATAASIVAFLISTPGIFINWPKFSHDFAFEMRHSAEGHGLVFAGTSSGYLYHVSNLVLGVGGLLTLFAVAGLGYAAWRRHAWAIALLAFFLPYYVLIGRSEVKFLRYTLPLYVGLGVGFGWLIGEAHRRGGMGRVVVAGGILALGGVDGGGVRGSAQFSLAMAAPDARDVAAAYLKDQCKDRPESVVGLTSDAWFYTPPLYKETAVSRAAGFANLALWMAVAQRPKVVRYTPANPDERFDWDRRLFQYHPDYVVYSNFEFNDIARLSDRKDLTPEESLQVGRFKEFTTELDQSYRLEQRFGAAPPFVQDMQYVMPVVYVWKRKAL